jgi:hypothetical protein
LRGGTLQRSFRVLAGARFAWVCTARRVGGVGFVGDFSARFALRAVGARCPRNRPLRGLCAGARPRTHRTIPERHVFGLRSGIVRQRLGYCAGVQTQAQGERCVGLKPERLALVTVLQPGGARYGGGCNPDATRMQPGCNGPQSVASGLRPGCPQGVAAGRPEAVACNELDARESGAECCIE